MKKKIINFLLLLSIVMSLFPHTGIEASAKENYMNLCGRWEGYYTGSNAEQRDVVFYIDSCDSNGKIEGIFEFSMGTLYGQYHYTGSINFSNDSINFSGDYWIVNPDNYSFAKFDGNVDLTTNIITGTNNNDSNRPFELKKVSDNHDINSLKPSELIGTWKGSYDGHRSGTVITRNVTLYIQNCDNSGMIEGIFQFNSSQEPLSSGAYKFEGTYSFNTGVINFKGMEWIDNPDNFSFGQFTGFSSKSDSINGYVDNNKGRTFSFKRVSDRIDIPLLDKDKIPTTWTGEYDGHHNDANNIVRRLYKINILDIDDDGNVHGLAEISPKPGVMYSASGSYRFTGKVNFMTKKIVFQGVTWIDYPKEYDNFSFAKFTAYISDDYKNLTGYVDNYSNRTIDMVSENNSTRGKTNSTSEGAPIIKSATVTHGGTDYDIFKQAVNIEADSDISVNVKATVDNNGCNNVKLYVTQGVGNEIEITNTGLSFKPGKELSAGKTVYIIAVDEDTGKSTSKATKLKITESASGSFGVGSGVDGLNFSLGKNTGFTVPDSVPVFGGTEIGWAFDFIPVSVEYDREDDNKINVVFGTNIVSEEYKKNGVDRKYFSDFNFKEYKKAFSHAKRTQKHSLKDLRKFFDKGTKPDYKFFKGAIAGSGKGKTGGDIDVAGYAEMKYLDGKWQFVEGELALNAEVKYTYQGQVFIWVVPMYYEFGGGVGAGIEGKMIDLNPNGFSPKFEGYLTAKIMAEIGGGVGIAKVATAGASGEGSLNIKTALFKEYLKSWGEGSASFNVKVFGKTVAEKEFARGDFLIYETGNSKGLIKDKNAIKLQSVENSIYDTIDINAIYENESRDYADNPTEWLGENAPINLMSADFTNKNLNKLASNIYTESAPQICEVDGKKVMVMQWDNAERADADRTMLVYSVYDDASGTWSAPVTVADDGTADFYPCFKDGWLVWQNEKSTLAEDMTLKEIAELGEIYAAKWNGSGFDAPIKITDNNTLDTQPTVAASESGASIVWTTNTEGDILGITGKNSIMRSDFDGTSWSAPAAVKNDLNVITNIVAGNANNNFVVAYVVDDDNDLNTIDDRDIRIITTGGETQLTNNEVIDSNPVFADNKIYYYCGGNIAHSDIDGSNAATVFDDAKPGLTDTFVVDSNANGDTAIWWTKAQDNGAEVYASLYDDGAWSDEIQITSVGNRAKYPSGILNGNGSMVVAFNNGVVENDVITQTDLYTISVNPSYDIEITDAYFDEDTMTAYATVKNSGEKEIASYTAAFMGNNSKTVTMPLKAGESTEVELEYNKPLDLSKQNIELAVSITDGEEYNTDNNKITFEIGHADIAVENVSANDDETAVTANISNIGYADADNVKVQIRDGSEDGTVISEKTISLSKNASQSVEFNVDKSNLRFMDASKTLFVTASTTDDEVSLGNNDGYAVIASASGSADYEVEILNYSEIDGKYVINSIARNNTDKELICQLFSAIYSDDGTLKGCSYKQAVIDANDDTGVDIPINCSIEEGDQIKTFMWKYYEPLAKASDVLITK